MERVAVTRAAQQAEAAERENDSLKQQLRQVSSSGQQDWPQHSQQPVGQLYWPSRRLTTGSSELFSFKTIQFFILFFNERALIITYLNKKK
jgi:hypothetical protein